MAGPNPTAPVIGDTIRELRERDGRSLEDLAGDAGVHTTTLSKFERGITNPRWETLRVLATALEMDSSTVIRLAEAMTPERRREVELAAAERVRREKAT